MVNNGVLVRRPSFVSPLTVDITCSPGGDGGQKNIAMKPKDCELVLM